MGKRGQNKKKGKGAEKTLMKKEKKLAAKHKKMLERIGERDIVEIVNALEQEQARVTSVFEEICAPPSPRSNFSLVAHPSAQELVLFGGEFYNGKNVTVYNDMFFYATQTQQWRQLRAPAGPTPRSGHQMVAVPTEAGGELWLFGGEHASPSQLQFYHYRDLWVFHLAARRWERVEAPNPPSARSGHRMVLLNRQLVLFGGFYDNYQTYEYYNDVHLFDLHARQWRQIMPEGFIKPAPRSGGCMAAYPDGRILIWGGYTKTKLRKQVDAGRTFTDMFEIFPQPNPAVTGGVQFFWRLVKPGGHNMLPLNSVSFAAAPNQQVFCFGGVIDEDEDDDDLHGQFTQDLTVLDLPTQSWRLCEFTETESTAAAVTQSSVQPSTTITSTDGSLSFSVKGSVAPTPSAESFLYKPNLFRKQSRFLPTPRMHAGLCVLNNTLYLFGGIFEVMDRVYTYNDFYALDLSKMSGWEVLIPNNENAHEWLESDGEDELEKAAISSSDDDDDDDEEDEEGEENDDSDDDNAERIESKESMDIDAERIESKESMDIDKVN